jgi:hypothetical protein
VFVGLQQLSGKDGLGFFGRFYVGYCISEVTVFGVPIVLLESFAGEKYPFTTSTRVFQHVNKSCPSLGSQQEQTQLFEDLHSKLNTNFEKGPIIASPGPCQPLFF